MFNGFVVIAVAVVALLVGAYLGPSILKLLAEAKSDVKADYDKALAAAKDDASLAVAKLKSEDTQVIADLTAAKAKAEADLVIAKNDLSKAVAKAEAFADIFKTQTQPSVVPAATPVTNAIPATPIATEATV